MLFSLTYVSSATELLSPTALEEILTVSRLNNQAAGITGMLLYSDGNIIQVLEGSEAAVRQTFGRIEKDPRHHRTLILLRETIEERAFEDWSMGFQQLDAAASPTVDGINKVLTDPAATGSIKRQTVRILIKNFRDMVS